MVVTKWSSPYRHSCKTFHGSEMVWIGLLIATGGPVVDSTQLNIPYSDTFRMSRHTPESVQVLWHGMGDSCCEPFRSVGAIKKLIEEKLGRLCQGGLRLL